MKAKRQRTRSVLHKKPDRPVIEEDSTDKDWALFVDAWGRYKEICDLVEIRNDLRTVCLLNVNRLLFQLLGSETLNIATEEQLLHQIGLVAVKGLHKEVHRHTFHNIRQQEGEGISHFLARLQSQARLCEFTVKCTNGSCQQQVNYSADMAAGQFIAGLLNTEHQGKILAEANILMTLEQKLHRLVSLETTDKVTPTFQTT